MATTNWIYHLITMEINRYDLWEINEFRVLIGPEEKDGGQEELLLECENMIKRAKFTAPKLWIRRNRRLCRNYSVEYYPESQNIISNSCKELRGTSILDLPDECLITVFKSLTAYELCSVSRVCQKILPRFLQFCIMELYRPFF